MQGFLRSLSAIALLLLAACSPSPSPSPSPQAATPLVESSPVVANPRPSPSPTIPGNPFQKGIDRASSAETLAQSAQSRDDWNLVISRWQEAIALMQAVPKTSQDYKTAQQRLTDYRRSLSRAQQQAKRGPQAPTGTAPPTEGVPLIAGESPLASPGAISPTPEPSPQDPQSVLNQLNQEQINFFKVQNRFASSLAELGSKISAETSGYTYNTIALQPDQAMSTAISRRKDFSSYTAAIFMRKEGDKTEPVTILCRSDAGSPPAMPKLEGKEAKCAPGSTKV